MSKNKRVLGLDCGTSSIGWAVTEQIEEFDEESKSWYLSDVSIVDGGVRLFDEMVAPDKGRDTLNSERRKKRGVRRLIARRKRRMVRLLALLRKFGFLPQEITATEIRNAFIEIEKQNSIYQLRCKALDEKLSELELVKVLYHLAKRRGFRSNRKDKKNPEELEKIRQDIQAKTANLANTEALQNLMHNDGASDVKSDKVYTAIEALKIMIQQSGARTLGEYFALQENKNKEKNIPERLRGIYLERSMIEDELRKILAKQAGFYPVLTENHLTKGYESFWKDLRTITNHTDMILDTILEPRPLKDQRYLIGKCPYFPQEYRLAKSALLFQEFDLRSKINNMKYRLPEGKDMQELTAQQKEQVFQLAWGKEKVTWKAIKKELSLPEETHFNFEAGGKKAESSQSKELRGGRTNAIFIKILGQDLWHSFDDDVKEELVALYSLGEIAFNKEFKKWMDQYGAQIPAEKYEALYDLDLPNSHDYGSYSRKMLCLVLPLVKEGLREQTSYAGQANEKIGYIDRLMAEGKIKKPAHETPLMSPEEIAEINNPRIKKMLFEMRKLLLALERKYGPEIRENWHFVVEMAREMRKDEDKKRNDMSYQNEQQQKREAAREIGAKNRDQILKHTLWLETDNFCAYCNRHFNQSEILSHEVEIEHIVPLSRLVDDSQANKTIACRDCNQEKQGRLPWEAWGSDSQRWQAMNARWDKWVKEGKLPRQKRYRLAWDREDLQKQAENFSPRQLNETRYGSKEIRKMLERWIGEGAVHEKRQEGQNYQGKRVATTKGGFTNRIRQALDLNTSSPYKRDGSPKDNFLLARIENKKDGKPLDPGKNKKERLDHRHHFIDAAAMTLIGPALEQRFSHMAQAEEVIKQRLHQCGIPTKDLDTLLDEGITYDNLLVYVDKHAPNKEQADKFLKEFENPKSLLRKQFNNYEARSRGRGRLGLHDFIDEWQENFYRELNEHLGSMIVSQAITHKISGALHEETCYGVLRAIPVSYLDQDRISKLHSDGYISQEVLKALEHYVDQYKFIDEGSDSIRRKEADDKYLWAFRRGRQKPNSPLLPPPLEMKEFWDDAVHGPYKKDAVPLLNPIYTKSSKEPGKSAKDIADVRLRNQILPNQKHAQQLKAQWESLRNLPEYKNKKKDWTLENLNQFQSQPLYEAVKNYQQQHPDMSVDHILPILTDDKKALLPSGQPLKSVLLLNFAARKFIPSSPEDKHKAFDTGSNHHIAVFKREKEGEEPLSVAVLVTTVDAARRGKAGEPIIRRTLIQENLDTWATGKAKKTQPEEWRFFCSLIRNDYVELDDGNIYRVSTMDGSNKNLCLCAHFFAGEYSQHNSYELKLNRLQKSREIPAAIKLQFSGLTRIKRKVYVNPLGGLSIAHD